MNANRQTAARHSVLLAAIPPNELGDLIRDRRAVLNLQQCELATRLGQKNQTVVCAWENGHRAPPPKRLRQLLSILKVVDEPDVQHFLAAWQRARMRLQEHLRDMSVPLTLGEIIRRELDEPLAEVWVLACVTLQQSGMAVEEIVRVSQTKVVTFCMEGDRAFELTARPILTYLRQLAPRDNRVVRRTASNVRFVSMGSAFALGFKSQSITLHVYRRGGRVRAYSGPGNPRTVNDPITEVDQSTARDLLSALSRVVGECTQLRHWADGCSKISGATRPMPMGPDRGTATHLLLPAQRESPSVRLASATSSKAGRSRQLKSRRLLPA